MTINKSQIADLGTELKATMNGTWVEIGALPFNPVIAYFDNLGTSEVQISKDGGNTVWKTFGPGTALSMDLRGNHGVADNFTFPRGYTFYGNGASGDFSISYIYAVDQ